MLVPATRAAPAGFVRDAPPAVQVLDSVVNHLRPRDDPQGTRALDRETATGIGVPDDKVKLLADRATPPDAVTWMRPLAAPSGTISLSRSADSIVNELGVEATLVAVAALSPVPLTRISVPTGPLSGVIDAMETTGCGAPPLEPPPPQADKDPATSIHGSRCHRMEKIQSEATVRREFKRNGKQQKARRVMAAAHRTPVDCSCRIEMIDTPPGSNFNVEHMTELIVSDHRNL